MPDLDIITFGCRLNAYESEVMRAQADAAGLSDAVIVNTCAVTAEAVRQARQAIRKARRDRPEAKIIVTGCAAQIDPARFAAMDRSRSRDRQPGEARSEDVREIRRWRQRARRRQRHHVGARDGRASGRGFRRPRPRLCANPERVRSSLHLLHHPVRARTVALGAGGRSGGASAPACGEGLCRDRADGRGHHRLWQGPARRDDARQAGALRAQARPRAAAAQALLDRLGRGGCGAARRDRGRGAADAASASFAAIRRRSYS